MFTMSIPIWEFVVRAVVVYLFLLVMLRLTGKRQIGQLSPFDLVLLLVLSNAVQNSMNGGDNSLIGGMISAIALVLLNFLVGYISFRNKRLELWIEGEPKILAHNGKARNAAMTHEQITHHELMAAI